MISGLNDPYNPFILNDHHAMTVGSDALLQLIGIPAYYAIQDGRRMPATATPSHCTIGYYPSER